MRSHITEAWDLLVLARLKLNSCPWPQCSPSGSQPMLIPLMFTLISPSPYHRKRDLGEVGQTAPFSQDATSGMEAGLLRLRFPAQSQPGIQTAQRFRMFMRFLVIVVCTFAGLHRSPDAFVAAWCCASVVVCSLNIWQGRSWCQIPQDLGGGWWPSIVLEEDCWTCARLQEDLCVNSSALRLSPLCSVHGWRWPKKLQLMLWTVSKCQSRPINAILYLFGCRFGGSKVESVESRKIMKSEYKRAEAV